MGRSLPTVFIRILYSPMDIIMVVQETSIHAPAGHHVKRGVILHAILRKIGHDIFDSVSFTIEISYLIYS